MNTFPRRHLSVGNVETAFLLISALPQSRDCGVGAGGEILMYESV